jgi:hypothetical protein
MPCGCKVSTMQIIATFKSPEETALAYEAGVDILLNYKMDNPPSATAARRLTISWKLTLLPMLMLVL